MIPEVVVAQTSLPILVRRGGSSAWRMLDNRFPINRVYCIGRNYKDHAIEMGADPREPPFFFQKPSNAVFDTYGGGNDTAKVPYPSMTTSLHYEGELVVAIAKEGGGTDNGISVKEASSHIFGFSVGCDLTRRDLQAEAKKRSRPWSTAKGFDHSAPCAPIIPRDQVTINGKVSLKSYINGENRQEATLDHMVWSIPETIADLSRYFRLMPGDLIFTGTPAGVGEIKVGDLVSVTCGELPPCNFAMGE